MYQDYKLAIVVPAYNEEKLISETLAGIPSSADRVYVVDDGSTDFTCQIVKGLINERICLLCHGHNRGVGAAIVTGYKKALEEGMDIAVVMAGDNQMDPNYLPDLLAPLVEKKADYVKGNRWADPGHLEGMTRWRFLGNWLLRWLTRISSGNFSLVDPQDGYTAISSETLKRMNLDNIYPYYGYCNDILVKLSALNARISEVPRPYTYTDKAKSKIKYWQYIPKVSMLLLRDFFWRLRIGSSKNENLR
jgi:glycosyltransferase involved in cell wall biosynthesis